MREKIANFIYTDFSNANFCAPNFILLLAIYKDIEKINILSNAARIEFTDTNTTAIIAPIEASKDASVRLMQKIFSGNKSIFIENDKNDLSGFKVYDVKVAVANACDELLAKADIVIADNHDAVGHYLNDL